MKNFKMISALIFSIVLLSGCNEGPAEKQGKKIDNAVENVKDKIQDKGPLQKAGEKIDDATGN